MVPVIVPWICRQEITWFFYPLYFSVLVRYVREDGKLHTVNLQNPGLSDGRTQSLILHVGGLQQNHLHMELYVNCRLADSAQVLPSMVQLPAEAESVEIRNGQKAYARLQVIKHNFFIFFLSSQQS